MNRKPKQCNFLVCAKPDGAKYGVVEKAPRIKKEVPCQCTQTTQVKFGRGLRGGGRGKFCNWLLKRPRWPEPVVKCDLTTYNMFSNTDVSAEKIGDFSKIKEQIKTMS